MQLIDILRELVIEHELIIYETGRDFTEQDFIYLEDGKGHFTYSIVIHGTTIVFGKLHNWSTDYLGEIDMCNPNSIEELKKWLRATKEATVNRAWL